MHCFAAFLPIWAMLPSPLSSLCIYTNLILSISKRGSLLAPGCLLHETPFLCTCKSSMTLLYLLSSIPTLIIMPLLGCPFHNAPLLSFLALPSSSSSLLAVLLCIGHAASPSTTLLSFFSCAFFLMGRTGFLSPWCAPPFSPFFSIEDTLYTCALPLHT